ncbi:MAG: cell division protein FtsA [Bacteroidales bacterium]|nr:cell division protein FtsA [Bacteroidales bacterium]
MDNQEIIVGLDIGTTKIACFVGMRGENNKVKILGFGRTESIGVENGVVRSITGTAESIKHAVEQAADQANVNIDEVWVGIAGQHIKSRPSQGSVQIPPEHQLIEESDVERLINEQFNTALPAGEEIIHIFPQLYVVDNEPLSREIPPVGVQGKTLVGHFHMVTGNVTNLQHIRLAVERAGLHIKGVVLEPIASALAVLSDSEKEAGVALVDIGGGTTDIAIFHDGIIRHTSVLPLAGNAITNDIREECNILKRQAEGLKVKFGSCLTQAVSANDVVSVPGMRNQAPREIYVKTLANIINARTKMILEQVDYEIQLSGLHEKLIAGVVLTGGGAQLRHIKDLCELISTISTRTGTPDEHLTPDSTDNGELAHPMYATGIGLLLYGLEQSERLQTRNAEPEEETPQETPVNPNDIFAGMPDVPTQPMQPSTPKQEEPQSKATDKKKDGLGKAISKFLERVFNEKIDGE